MTTTKSYNIKQCVGGAVSCECVLCIVGGAITRAQARILKQCLGGCAALRKE